jgi:hypothetical protein
MRNLKDLKFTSIRNACKEVGVSYLTKTASSAKLVHSVKVSDVITTGLYLAPAYQYGKLNSCSHRTKECEQACLVGSGRARMELVTGSRMIRDCREVKTRLFYENTNYFMQWLIAEIIRDKAKVEKQGHFYAVRLNCTSDIDWANVLVNGQNIFEIFPDVQFYDYSKNPSKFIDIAKNYHLTFSYTGKNASKANELLNKGFNVAVVFNTKANKPLPETFAGIKVVDGDLTDYRVTDGSGVIVGLRFKMLLREASEIALKSIFVVDENNPNASALAMSKAKVLEMV